MRCIFFWISLGFSIGIVLQHVFNLSSQMIWVSLFGLLPFLWHFRGTRYFIPTLVMILIPLGYHHAQLETRHLANAVQNWAIDSDSAKINTKLQTRITLIGNVASLPEIKVQGRKRTVSFILSADHLRRKVSSQYEEFEVRGCVQVFLYQPQFNPSYGEMVSLSGYLVKPRPVLNPGEFNYGEYLAQKNIHALFHGYGSWALKSLGQNKASWFMFYLEKVRLQILNWIDHLFEPEAAGLFKALILGIRKQLSPELRDEFMKTGTSHLVAISGLNISLVAGSVYLLLIFLRIRRKLAALIAFVLAVCYVLIAGSGIPVQRAGWMAVFGFLALIIERERNALNTFFMALFFLLLTQSQSLFQVSFQLSFISVFALIIFFREFRHSFWKQWIGESLAVLSGTFPLVIYYFNVFSLVSLFANLGAVPLFHFALLFSILALWLGFIPYLGPLMVYVAQSFLQWGLNWIHVCSLLPFSYLYVPKPYAWQLTLYYFALILFLFFKRQNNQRFYSLTFFSCSLWLMVGISMFYPKQDKNFEMTFLSAGKNEMIYWQFGQYSRWLLNTGRYFPSDQANWILCPFLRQKGIKRLNGLLMMDAHKRHTGGLPTILRNFTVDTLGTSPFLLKKQGFKFPHNKTNWKNLKKGDKIKINEHEWIEILDQFKDQLIFRIVSYGKQILILPDLNEQIVALLDNHKDQLIKIDVLFLPSGFFVSEKIEQELFDLMDPQWVIMPSPDEQLEAFLLERDINLLDLQRLGAVTLKFESIGEKNNFSVDYVRRLK